MVRKSFAIVSADENVTRGLNAQGEVSASHGMAEVSVEDALSHIVLSRITIAEPAALAITIDVLARELAVALDHLIVSTRFLRFA